MSELKAVLVCVDFSDLLSVTLPYNRHHFKETHVVTSLSDTKTEEVAVKYGATVWKTNLFYKDGAIFNKWRSLEWALDQIGRDGWMCLLDVDVLWPKEIPEFSLVFGQLYSPLRHMFGDLTQPIPEESDWEKYLIHDNVNEWAGYTQIFHAEDPVLPDPPWHSINWSSAAGADSFFQMLWSRENKVRPPFNVLHLGPAGENWCGRAVPYLDGTFNDQAEHNKSVLRDILSQRKGKEGDDRFLHEKIDIT